MKANAPLKSAGLKRAAEQDSVREYTFEMNVTRIGKMFKDK